MKRNHKPYTGVYKVWPYFFWLLCIKCKLEFRRQPGWRREHGVHNHVVSQYICKECCPTEMDAHKYFTKIPPRPKLPSGIPPKPEPPKCQILKEGDLRKLPRRDR